jgi:hypothetical protein
MEFGNERIEEDESVLSTPLLHSFIAGNTCARSNHEVEVLLTDGLESSYARDLYWANDC